MADEITRRGQDPGPDPVLLSAGAVAIVISSAMLLGITTSLQWIFAAVAIAGGVGLIIASIARKTSR